MNCFPCVNGMEKICPVSSKELEAHLYEIPYNHFIWNVVWDFIYILYEIPYDILRITHLVWSDSDKFHMRLQLNRKYRPNAARNDTYFYNTVK